MGTGYHALEFLFGARIFMAPLRARGRDRQRISTWHVARGGNCQRRVDYLKAAAALLVADLEEMVPNWRVGGAARRALAAGGRNGARPRCSPVSVRCRTGNWLATHEAGADPA